MGKWLSSLYYWGEGGGAKILNTANSPPLGLWMATDLLTTAFTPVKFRKLSVKKKEFMRYGKGCAGGGGRQRETELE